jgi:hypothetical protein
MQLTFSVTLGPCSAFVLTVEKLKTFQKMLLSILMKLMLNNCFMENMNLHVKKCGTGIMKPAKERDMLVRGVGLFEGLERRYG